MGRAGLLLLAGVALGLAGVLAWQWWPEPPAVGVSLARAEASPPRQEPPASAERPAQMAAVLARPLFEPTRRPPAAAATDMGAAAPSLPRVAGVLVGPSSRSAIFMVPGSSAPVVAHEGGRVGEYTVRTIAAGEVTLLGADGARTLRPGFATTRSLATTPGLATTKPQP